ncbi:diguanylate cyclase domain-containing protein [Caenimonas terrae]|uniref:histidine kinase n=1 Tax=Caenimonas terrae TaxID=696074 RepID=A0ABW0NMQ8_9BURK
MSAGPDPVLRAEAMAEASRIQAEIDASREELAGLRRQVAAARIELVSGRAAHLVEANEHLVLAALAARRQAEASERALREMAEAAELDSLTGLPLPGLLRSRLATLIADAREDGSGAHVALVLLNLTDFKLIRDTLGHATGDQVLQLAARTLEAAARPIDTVSRHRGDEFLILLPQLADVSEAVEHAARIVGALGAPTMLNQQVLRLTASAGIAVYPQDGTDADALTERAVAAMYLAKWRGLGSYAFQGESGGAERSPQLRTLEALRQPLVDHRSAATASMRRNDQLQEANTQLLLAVLTAQDLKQAAEQALERQTNFLGVLAHELRNPLTPIRNAAAILGRIPTEGPLLGKLQGIIERQVRNMSRMVEDLLDVSRVSSGKLRLELVSVDMNGLIDDVVQACRPSMDTRLQQFDVHLAAGPLQVCGDALRLAQVLGNLLDNASKYTPEGGRVGLQASADGDRMVLTVSDNGIGITAQALATIFEPFVQEQHATLFNGRGLGIGLTVVRELVEGHGGTVSVASAGKGLGSRFTVTLPLERDPPAG